MYSLVQLGLGHLVLGEGKFTAMLSETAAWANRQKDQLGVKELSMLKIFTRSNEDGHSLE